MYISRVELDQARRSTMIALAAPKRLHGAVERSFAGERKRRLWRLDYLGGKLYLLILSDSAGTAVWWEYARDTGIRFAAAKNCSK